MGRSSVASVCLSVCRINGQGHTVTKTVTVAQLQVTRAAMAIGGKGLHVDTTANVFYLRNVFTTFDVVPSLESCVRTAM